MANFIQRLFSKAKNKDVFPKISFGFRLEGIHYETETHSLYIESSRIDEPNIYTDFIDKWKDETPITSIEKEEIFGQIVQFINKEGNTKPIIVINVDYMKEFWENHCQKHKNEIKGIVYDSNEKKENFQYNVLLQSVRNNGTLIFDDKTIKTEAELIEYWKNRNSREA